MKLYLQDRGWQGCVVVAAGSARDAIDIIAVRFPEEEDYGNRTVDDLVELKAEEGFAEFYMAT